MAKKKQTMAKGEHESPTEFTVPIEFHRAEEVITPFASNMAIQTLEYEFKISFFEVKPAIRITGQEAKPSSVRADCVASVIVNSEKLQGFIDALQKHLDKYKAKKTQEKKSS